MRGATWTEVAILVVLIAIIVLVALNLAGYSGEGLR